MQQNSLSLHTGENITHYAENARLMIWQYLHAQACYVHTCLCTDLSPEEQITKGGCNEGRTASHKASSCGTHAAMMHHSAAPAGLGTVHVALTPWCWNPMQCMTGQGQKFVNLGGHSTDLVQAMFI